MSIYLVGDTNDTASGAGASVASLLGLLVSTLAEIIGASVDNNGAANDTLRSNELNQLVLNASLSVTLGIGLEVTKVTNVALLILWGAVSLVVGVEVGSSGSAAIGVVAESVDVHATLSVGVVAGDVPCDGGLRVLVGLLEGDGSLDVGVSTEDSDSLNHVGDLCVG